LAIAMADLAVESVPDAAPGGPEAAAALGWLRLAEGDLVRAVRRHRDRIEPWCFLLVTGGRLRVPVAARILRYEEVHRREPFFPPAVFAAVVGLGQRLGGDSEETFGLARAVLEQVPPGHPSLAATPLAHVEATSRAPEDEIGAYFHREDVLAVLDLAFERWWGDGTAVPTASQRLAANAFAAAFTRADRHDEVRACVRRIGDHPDAAIWSHFPMDPYDMYQVVRHRLGLLGHGPRVTFTGRIADPGPG
jgi:hypothetical protein